MQISADHTRDHRHAIAEGGGGEATAGAHERKVGKEIRMDGSRRNCSDCPSRSM